jgi:protein-disulfide isomerase
VRTVAVNEARRAVTAATASLLLLSCTFAPQRVADDDARSGDVSLSPDSLRALADRSRIEGDTAAPLWLIIASDFQCPFCARWHLESHDSLRRGYIATGRVRAAYVNFPLDHHQHARVAASAALCAGVNDRFWPVHDGIFETQERWAPLSDALPLFDSLAGAAGADMPAWRSCMAQGIMDPVVRADRDRAAGTGVQSTPTFLLLPTVTPAQPGQMIRGAVPLPDLTALLDSLLAALGDGR